MADDGREANVAEIVRSVRKTWTGWPPAAKNLTVKDAIDLTLDTPTEWRRQMPDARMTVHRLHQLDGRFPWGFTDAKAVYKELTQQHVFHHVAMVVPTILEELGYTTITTEHPMSVEGHDLPQKKKYITGAADMVCTDAASGTRLYVVDVKTLDQGYGDIPLKFLTAKMSHFVQTGMYGYMLEKMAEQRGRRLCVDGLAVIGLDPFKGQAQAYTMPVDDYTILHEPIAGKRKAIWSMLNLQ